MAVLLSQHYTVKAVDILQEKVDMINAGKSPIIDKEIQECLSTKKLDLEATTDGNGAYQDAEFVIISATASTSRSRSRTTCRSTSLTVPISRKAPRYCTAASHSNGTHGGVKGRSPR